MPTLEFLGKVTTTGGAASITFSAIPQTFDDLVFYLSFQGSTGTNAALLSFNSTTSNYSGFYFIGEGQGTTSAGSYARYAGPYNGFPLGGNIYANTYLYIPRYAQSIRKMYMLDGVSENNGSTNNIISYGGLWDDASAITSVTFTTLTSVFNDNSTATLYGIKNA